MRRSMIGLAVVAMVLAACGGDGADSTTLPAETTPSVSTPAETQPPAETTTPPETTAPETTTPAETTVAMAGTTVAMAESDLGSILVDAEGNTLYLFMPDAQGDSTCYDDCATNWPALTGEASAGDGVDASLLGTTERTDGEIQATYNGWPLYYFANDAAPGDVNGQGVGDVWFVLDAAGEPGG